MTSKLVQKIYRSADNIDFYIVDNNHCENINQHMNNLAVLDPRRIFIVKTGGRNLGYGKGVNTALKYGAYHDLYSGFYFINPDVDITQPSQTITKLLEFCKNQNVVGVRYLEGESLSSDYGFWELEPFGSIGRKLGKYYLNFKSPNWSSLAFFYVKLDVVTEVIKRFGRCIPEEYFLYYEDVEFGKNLKLLGYQPVIYTDGNIKHLGKRSSLDGNASYSEITTYYLARNRVLFARKNFSFNFLILFFIFLLALFFRDALLFFMVDKHLKPKFKCSMKGVFDGCRKRI